MEVINLQWKIEQCQKCRCIAVKSQDSFLECLKCGELSQESVSQYPNGGCVYCGQPLILLMEACLTCGNQPRQGNNSCHWYRKNALYSKFVVRSRKPACERREQEGASHFCSVSILLTGGCTQARCLHEGALLAIVSFRLGRIAA